jgi:hypothetical protein
MVISTKLPIVKDLIAVGVPAESEDQVAKEAD